MLIKEVCELCGVTRKAVEYYERQGFIQPEVLENGYRNYAPKEIATLKEISVLRKCGIGIQDIRTILNCADKSVALARYRRLNDLKMKRLKAIRECIDSLISNYDVEEGFQRLKSLGDECLTVQEKLVLAFPGSYGLYLSLHFGRYLNEPFQTCEQRAAYEKIDAYLDRVQTQIPDELGAYLEQAMQFTTNADMEKYEETVNHAIEEAIRDPEAYFRNMPVEEYIAYRISEDFKQSPAGQMSRLMTEFQKDSGYRDVFLENLKLLSPAYKAYCERHEAANAAFLTKYPQAGGVTEHGG